MWKAGDRVVDVTDPRHVAAVTSVNKLGGWSLNVVFESGYLGSIDLNNARRAADYGH